MNEKLEEIIERALEEQVAKGTPMFKTYRVYAERACRGAVRETLLKLAPAFTAMLLANMAGEIPNELLTMAAALEDKP